MTTAVLPGPVSPMLASASTLPPDPSGWAFEVKWDGMRVVLHATADLVAARTRTMREVTASFPELAHIGAALDGRAAVLDGEIVAFDDHGRPDFARLQPRMQASPLKAAAMCAEIPVSYVVFDLVWLEGRWTVSLPYEQRRELLTEVLSQGPAWRVPAPLAPPLVPGYEDALEAAVRSLGLEGVVAKQLGSPYLPGERSGTWRKVKFLTSQEFVVGGWKAGAGSRAGGIGSLLLGVRDRRGGDRLVYCGRVGTGMAAAELERLHGELAALVRPDAPFDPLPPDRTGVVWVDPVVVVDVAFTEWTPAGILRQPTYRGRRPDKDPADVVRE